MMKLKFGIVLLIIMVFTVPLHVVAKDTIAQERAVVIPQQVGTIEITQSGVQLIPAEPLVSSENLVDKGTMLYRMTYKIKILDKNRLPIKGVQIPIRTSTSNTIVKGMSISGTTNSNGEYYAYFDIRGNNSFTVIVEVNNMKKQVTGTTKLNCSYESLFYTTGYILAAEKDYNQVKRSAPGITGYTFKSDFLDAVKMNGSGVADNNVKIRYNSTTGKYELGEAKTASGTTPTAGRTIAVDNYYIPRYKVSGSTYKRGYVYIEGIGYRTAEDAGGKIKGYKIDVFMGIGKSSVSGFQNKSRKVTLQNIITASGY